MAELRSEVAGSIWKINYQPGDRVAAGDPVVIVEAMKMEIPVESPVAARIDELLVNEGDPVQEGQLIAKLTPG